MDTGARIHYPYIDEALLNNFRETNASNTFCCRFKECVRYYDGFENEEALRQHERCHVSRIMCTETACTYASQLGFKTAAELRRHVRKYHQQDNSSVSWTTFSKRPMSTKNQERKILMDLEPTTVPRTMAVESRYLSAQNRLQYPPYERPEYPDPQNRQRYTFPVPPEYLDAQTRQQYPPWPRSENLDARNRQQYPPHNPLNVPGNTGWTTEIVAAEGYGIKEEFRKQQQVAMLEPSRSIQQSANSSGNLYGINQSWQNDDETGESYHSFNEPDDVEVPDFDPVQNPQELKFQANMLDGGRSPSIGTSAVSNLPREFESAYGNGYRFD